MIDIYDSKSCKSTYFPEKKQILFVFVGVVNIEDSKEMYVKVLDFMKTHKTLSFINDLRLMKGTFTKLNAWVIEQMRPAIQMGLKYDAMVVNQDIFTSFAIEDLMKKTSAVEIKLFQTVEDAERWIAEKTQP